ncbi:MAG: lysophospholipid acyltransferase family protein, partial [Rikenellaceae bacterium]
GQMLFFKDDIMVKRGDAESTKKMMLKCFKTLKDGISIAMFPEGTRSKNGCVNEFKEGAFIIAKKGRVPILPIVVQGTWEAENKGKMGLLNPNTFIMNILPEIPVEKIKEMGIRELCDYTHDMIYNKHREVSPWLYELAEAEEKEKNK